MISSQLPRQHGYPYVCHGESCHWDRGERSADANASEVEKLESMPSQYRRELRKLEKSKSGAGTDDIYTPTLWCFDGLCFLGDGDCMGESVSDMDSQAFRLLEEVSDHEVST